MSTSLNKYISQTGICSRREADTWIEAGRVKLNGIVAQKGNRAEEGDSVTIDGKPLKSRPALIYIALNKPPGVTCTTDLSDSDNIIDFIKHPQRIFPIGRLDKFSSGLIFLTNDGDIVNEILREENEHQKEYEVRVNQPITKEFLQRMRKGIPILGTVTKKCIVEQKDATTFRIILTQGLNRQIRRMCEYLDYRVSDLRRIRIMDIKLSGLQQGKWRNLTAQEIKQLKAELKHSSKR